MAFFLKVPPCSRVPGLTLPVVSANSERWQGRRALSRANRADVAFGEQVCALSAARVLCEASCKPGRFEIVGPSGRS